MARVVSGVMLVLGPGSPSSGTVLYTLHWEGYFRAADFVLILCLQ